MYTKSTHMQPGYQPDTVVIGESTPQMGQVATSPFSTPISGWNMELKDILLSFDGRINRQRWWLIGIAVYIVAFIYAIIIGVITFGIENDIVWGLVFSIAILPFSYVYVALDIKRLQDTGRGWEWGWLSVAVVIIGVIYNCTAIESDAEKITYGLMTLFHLPSWVICGFFKGDSGPNQHGEDPLGGIMMPLTGIPGAVYQDTNQ